MTEIYLSQKEVAELENVTERAIRKKFKQNCYKMFRYVESEKGGGKKGKRLEIALSSINIEARARYYKGLREDNNHSREISDAQFDGFDREPRDKKDEAMRWLAVIEEFEDYAKRSGKKKRCKAAKDFCRIWRIEHPEERTFSNQTLFRKIKEFRDSGIEGLINKLGQSHNFVAWSEEAKAWLWQKYCNINRPTASWCIEQLKAAAGEKGWRLPSTATLRRYLERIDQETLDRWRKGEKYWKEHWLPSVLRDYEEMDPGELYVGDHKQFNVAVRHPSGRVLFPWITAWEDMRSRKILGWVPADIPSSNTINLSLKYAIEKCGAPEHVIIDNGRDFSAKHFSGGAKKRFRFKVDENETAGIYKLLGIEPHFCIPANARAKSIERWFWTLELNFEKAFATYRGNNVLNRPEGVDKRIAQGKDVLEWEEFVQCLENCIENYNQDHEHQGHGMNGQRPNEVWNEYFESHAQRRVSPISLRLLMMKSSKPVKVGRFGVMAFGEPYRSSEVMDHQGEMVVYRYEPKDLSTIHVYDTEWKFISLAEKVHRTAWDDEEAYHVIKKLEKKKKLALKAEREAAENLAEVEFGYKKKEPSGEHPDKSAKIVRVLRTQLDGVEKSIEHRAESIEQDKKEGLSPENFSERFNEITRRRLEKRREKKTQMPKLFKLSMPGTDN